MIKVIRVFPRHTTYTPTDGLAFVGDPPLWRPEADEVHISVTFSWDVAEGERLLRAWAQYYPFVVIGGPAIRPYQGDAFTPGLYVKQGVTFTSRGCNNRCPWCLVPEREGRLRELPIQPGHIIADNNFLQCSPEHRRRVYAMLDRQPRAARFSGGLDARLVTDEVAAELRAIRIDEVFLAADTDGALRPLEAAIARLAFLRRRQLRCYVLCGFGGETVEQARRRLEAVWEMGALPFAQLYQPPDRWIDYNGEWRALAREWSRPAAMFANHEREG